MLTFACLQLVQTIRASRGLDEGVPGVTSRDSSDSFTLLTIVSKGIMRATRLPLSEHQVLSLFGITNGAFAAPAKAPINEDLFPKRTESGSRYGAFEEMT